MNLEGVFPNVEMITWVDNDAQRLHLSIGGLRFYLQHEDLIDGGRFSAVWAIHSRIYACLEALAEGISWLGGIWDVQWALAHGAFHGELLG